MRDESRSVVVRRSALWLIRRIHTRRERIDEQAYRQIPETEEERAWAEAATRIAGETWPEWDSDPA